MQFLAGQLFLNHLLESDELRRQIQLLAGAGFEVIYAHARCGLLTPYLSQKWWDAIQIMQEECLANRIKFAIWDEDYFPSGIAGNRIIWEHPELHAQDLKFTQFDVSGNTSVYHVFEEEASILRCFAICKSNAHIIDISNYCGSVRDEWQPQRIQYSNYSHASVIDSPHWRCALKNKRFALLWDAPCGDDYTIVAVQVTRLNGSHNTDLLNIETTKLLLEMTHEEYFKRFSFANTASSFMDEPSPNSHYAWTGKFAEEFQKDHGFNLLANLPHMVLNLGERSHEVRFAYRETLRRLLCENYLDPIQKWCKSHGILSIGHLTRTEYIAYSNLRWPNELRCCKHLDVPCTDPLCYHIAWPDSAGHHTGIKVVSSAARLFGKAQCGSDALAVAGDEMDIRQMRFSLDFQMALGINYFNIHGLNYSIDGSRKDETPPSLSYQHPQFPMMADLYAHVKKCCQALTGGTPVRKIAVLYPDGQISATADNSDASMEKNRLLAEKFHHLAEKLLFNQKDFDFIDGITLGEKDWSKEFDVLIVNHLFWVDAKTELLLEKWPKRLIFIGEQPEKLIHTGEFFPAVTNALLASLPGENLSGNGREHIVVRHEHFGTEDRYFCFNRSSRFFCGTLNGQAIQLPPGVGTLLDTQSPMPQRMGQELPVDWRIHFAANHIPLSIWRSGYIYTNLLNREKLPEGTKRISSEFFVCGEISSLELILEESIFQSVNAITVNGHLLPSAEKKLFWDCKQYGVDISSFLQSGTIETRNIIEFELIHPINDLPYLGGNFKSKTLHACRGSVYLEFDHGDFTSAMPGDWESFGRGTFSGTATYTATIESPANQEMQLELDQLEGAAQCYLNGVKLATFTAAPYLCDFNCPSGSNQLTILLANSPANRTRLSGLKTSVRPILRKRQ